MAHRDNAPESMILNQWSVGGSEWQFNAAISFYADNVEADVADPLQQHPIDWLVHLISATSAHVNADQNRIEPTELIDARFKSIVGALTLVPNSIGDAVLPDSITAYPCTVRFLDGCVLTVDLDLAANDPASLVPDLLTLDDILQNPQ